MSILASIVSKLSGSKTLQQAQSAASDVSAVEAKIAACFAAASISLEDAMTDEHCIAKEIASAREDGEAKMQAELEKAQADNDALSKAHAVMADAVKAHAAIAAKLGLDSSATVEQINAAFDALGAKGAASVVASLGVPAPIPDEPQSDAKPAAKSDAEIYADYRSIKCDADRMKFYQANSDAIWRSSRSANN